MRMWMTNPRIMCRQHLIGEYRELFTFVGSIKKQISLDGYFKNNLVEPKSLISRYKQLKEEMLFRKYEPKAKFIFNDNMLNYLDNKKFIMINKSKAKKDLLSRCEECNRRYKKYKYSHTSWNKGLIERKMNQKFYYSYELAKVFNNRPNSCM